jgi:RimJ/RimL family protein N-acetyltransferase
VSARTIARVEELRLTPLATRHLPALRELVKDPDVQRFTRVPVPTPPEWIETWLAFYEQGRRDGSREGFAIEDPGGAFLGLAFAVRIDADTATTELGYVVAPAARGRGVARHALGELTRWAFSELGMLRAELMISVGNAASKRVATCCGYHHEGVLRSMYVKPGMRDDLEIWSRLASDPSPA